MARKKRPNLKDDLRTGIVQVMDPEEEEKRRAEAEAEKIAATEAQEGGADAPTPPEPATPGTAEEAAKSAHEPTTETTPPTPQAEDGTGGPETPATTEEAAPAEAACSAISAEEVLSLLSEADRPKWEMMLQAAGEILRQPFNAAAVCADFEAADRSRFTYYLLASEGAALSPLRTAGQVAEDARAILRWDETGAVVLWANA